MATVQNWTGIEVRALRHAKRMTLRKFAAHLGVSERMVSKWEAGKGAISPRPVNQAALDTSLSRSDADTQARFRHLTKESLMPSEASMDEPPLIGAQRIRHEVDGSEMVLVDGSVFLAGVGGTPVWVPSFYIDVYPVTNAKYAQFVAATGHAHPEHWIGGAIPRGRDDHPVVFVSWDDAHAYASWAKKDLPSSSQWEKAARGNRGLNYPWGDQATPAKCNVRESGIACTTPVDRYQSGASSYGAYDMCGNIWEWCRCESSEGRRELKRRLVEYAVRTL